MRQRSAITKKAGARPAFSFDVSLSRNLLRRRQRQRFGLGRGRHDRRLLLALVQDQLVALDRDFADLGHRGAGARRDQPADDDVLLEAFQRIDLAVDGGLGEHAGGLLERRCREEGAGLQARLGDAEQNRRSRGGLLALFLGLLVDLVELDLVDLFARDHVGLALIGDLHLLQHLTDNHLDVLVVDQHALQPVDLLDFVDQIGGELLDALDRQDVVRRGIALDDEVTLLDDVAILQVDVLSLRDQVLARLLGLVGRLDRDAALVLVIAAEADRAGDFRDDGRVLRLASLEQFGHPRQTAGDVARLGAFGRDTGEDVARLDLGAGVDREDRVDREHVAGVAAPRQLQHLAVLALDHDRRAQIGAAALRTPVDDHALGDTGGLVQRLRDRLAFDQILEADRALDLRQHRTGERIPFGDAGAALDHGAVVDEHPRTVLDAVGRPLRAFGIDDRNHHVADRGDGVAVAVLDDRLVLDGDLALEVRLDERLLVDLRRTADVERAHGQLRAGLADRLRRDDADRFAVIDRRAAGQIAAIALAADAVDEFAGQRRADLHLADTGLVDGLDVRLLHQRAALDDHLARSILDVVAGDATEDTRAERGYHGAGVDDGAHLDAELGTAVIGGDDAVLRDVDQTAGQVAGVRGLQRGIRQSLAGAVGRVEVFENRQALLEVGDDRRLDDLARRFGHQAAHAGKLAHLRRRAARARMRHHVNRVDVGIRALGVLLGRGDFLHHLLGDLFGRLRPGVDDLVVLLAVGDQAVVVLLLEILGERACGVDDLPLAVRHDHVVLAERDAGLERIVEAERHDAVAEDHRLLLAAVAVDLVDDGRDLALCHQLVDDVVRNLRRLRQQVAEHYAAGGGLDPAPGRLARLIDALPAISDLAVEVDDLRVQGVLELGHVAEGLALAGQAFAHDRHIIKTEHDVLRRHDDRLAVGGMQDVVGRHHQDARFQLRFQRQRNVHGHLVAVEVGVEGGADQRMQLDRLALDQHGFERLDAE